MTAATYLPQDRLRALAAGQVLPQRCSGTALFADIAGFTPLSETLRAALGPRRAAEDVTALLDTVFSALIAVVEGHGGSVIQFAGDAIACWFDDADDEDSERGRSRDPLAGTAARAVAAALAMQQAMAALAGVQKVALHLKVGVASGAATRCAVGDPTLQRIDLLCGATVARSGSAEKLAAPGEVLVCAATAQALAARLTVGGWREERSNGQRFALATALAPLPPLPQVPPPAAPLQAQIQASALQPWLHPAVARAQATGHGGAAAAQFEFRPCVALFVGFAGIDCDSPAAPAQIDRFVCRMQALAQDHGGVLMDLALAERGGVAYLNFGALDTHENDARRALRLALSLRAAAPGLGIPEPLRAGLAMGAMRVGPFGGATRRCFGALGDDVNLAARLLQSAAAGEIVLSPAVHKAAGSSFVFEPRPPLAMKGKADPLPVFAVTAARRQRAMRLQEPAPALPMVGRQPEQQRMSHCLALAQAGQGQVVAIVAEAGLGKSRLVVEAIRLARQQGFAGYGGACQSDGVHTPYLAWRGIWAALFGVDPDQPPRRQLRALQTEVEDRAPQRLQALPLLAPLLELEMADNDFTRGLEPKLRQSSLFALLEDCLVAAAREQPTLVVIEDMHWIDAASHDLLEQLVRATAALPLCWLLAYRPPQLQRLQAPRLQALPQFTRIELRELNAAECEQAIRAKLAQLFPARSGALPPALLQRLTAKAQGNPFYLEELLHFLRDRGLDPRDAAALERIELPDSLHTLILSRIHPLGDQEKAALRAASVVGRLFRAAWLAGYCPELGAPPQLRLALDQLAALDITPLDMPEPDLSYLFKHIVIHEVTYESLPFALREQLHARLAAYLETAFPDAPPADLLAFHCGRGGQRDKQRSYLRRAALAAQQAHANDAALACLAQLLPLASDTADSIHIHLQRAALLQLMGQWPEAEADAHAALQAAQHSGDLAAQARAWMALASLCRLRSDYHAGLAWLAQAHAACSALNDAAGQQSVLTESGGIHWRRGDYVQARHDLEAALALARAHGDKAGIALALNILGLVSTGQGKHLAARALYEQSLALRRELGQLPDVAASLNNLGNVAWNLGEFDAARALHEESLVIKRRTGDKFGIAASLNNLANIALDEGALEHSRALNADSLRLRREIGDRWGAATSLGNLGVVALTAGDHDAALSFLNQSLALAREIGDQPRIAGALRHLGFTALARGEGAAALVHFEQCLDLAARIGHKPTLAEAQLGLGLLALSGSGPEALAAARAHLTASLRERQAQRDIVGMADGLLALAALVLRETGAARAARVASWLGTAQAALAAIHATPHIGLRALHAQTVAALLAELGAAGLDAACAAGRLRALPDAVSAALGQNQAPS